MKTSDADITPFEVPLVKTTLLSLDPLKLPGTIYERPNIDPVSRVTEVLLVVICIQILPEFSEPADKFVVKEDLRYCSSSRNCFE